MMQQPHTTGRSSERGASSVEYALLAALIALVIIVAVTAFGDKTTGLFQKTCSSVSSAQGGGAC